MTKKWMWGEYPDGRRYRIDLPSEDCPKCDRIFPSKQALENHLGIDHPELTAGRGLA